MLDASMRWALAALFALGAGTGAGAPGAGAPGGPGPHATARHVVIVGVTGLRWIDVDADRTPALAGIVQRGAAGSLSVRSAPAPARVTCAGEGWLTIGAGTYAALAPPAALGPDCTSRRPPPVLPDGDGGLVAAMPRLAAVNQGQRFGARPGLLGDSVTCAAAVGPGAALAVADRTGRVDAYAADLPADLGPLLGRCPLSAVDLGELPVGSGRDGALRAFDSALGTVEAHLPAGSVLIVVGVGEDGDRPHLHVAAVAGNGFGGGWLRSASTRRPPHVQLCDVAPTALRLLGRDAGVGAGLGAGVAGGPLSGGAPGRPAALAATAAVLADADTAATAQRTATVAFFTGFGVLALLVCGALAVLLRRRRRPPASPVLLRRLGVAALALAAVPAGTFAANLLPWWRSPWPVLTVTGIVLGAVALVVGASYAGPWRRARTGPVVVTSAVTVGVLAVDGLTGTTLQLNSLLGYNPLVAGRFTGFGNIAFAALGAAALLLAGALAAAVRDRAGGSRWAPLAVVAAVAVPVVALDGVPAWGADLGGVLTLVPAFVILGLLVRGARVSGWRLLGAGAAAVAVVAAIGVLDHQRPAPERSHFGRFVAAVLDGSAGGAIRRKLLANVDLLLAGPHTVAALVLVLGLTVVLLRPPPVLREADTRVPALRVGLVSVAALAWIGFATNDSGVAVPLVAALVAVPAALAVLARMPGPSVWQRTAGQGDGDTGQPGAQQRRYDAAT